MSERHWFLEIHLRKIALLVQSVLVLACALSLPVARARAAEKAPHRGLVFASYNVENYLSPAEGEEAEHRRAREKSPEAAAAVVQVIKDINPDILGICEMGDAAAFAEFQSRLRAAGLSYSDTEYVSGPDPDRHLALLSRFPIVARQSQADLEYELDGRREKVKRGILDVTVRLGDAGDLRLIGVHLKSKLAGDPLAELMRRKEANILRGRLDAILIAAPATRLLAYGDFNDTRDQAAIQEISGIRGTPGHMAELPACDSAGDRWTHYWRVADLYSRIDYLFASRALLAEIAPASCAVYRSPYWNVASDHRPISTKITPGGKKRKKRAPVAAGSEMPPEK